MQWPKDAAQWPLAQHSRIIPSPPHRWHMQEAGSGPTLLLLHGAGGATQSWRNLFPVLLQDHRVISIDLPGQGMTQAGSQSRFGLRAMAQDIATLCTAEGIKPTAIIGHSAGAAIGLQMALDGFETPHIIGINAALGEFKGVAGLLFPAMAKLLSMTPGAASLFASTATHSSVRKLLDGTGSNIDETGLDLYLKLVSDRKHVDGTLSMMAQWDLKPLLRALPSIDAPVTLIVGAKDKTVPPSVSKDAAQKLPNAQIITLDGLGHLAHEEDAQKIGATIKAALNTKSPTS